jgi:hypothetical protein
LTLLCGQQLAHKLAGPLAVVGRDVKVGDCSDHERAKGGDLDSALCRPGGDTRSGSRAGVDHDDIRLDAVRIDSGANAAGYGLGKDACCGMIISQSVYMMIKGVEARGGEHAGLSPAAAKPLPQHSGAGDAIRRTHQH